MPNTFKYSASTQTQALKKGNYWIGTGDSDKGPTSTTDYWNGISPITGGYAVYVNKASNGPSIFTPTNDSELIKVTQALSGTTFATGPSALNWYNSQVDKVVLNRDYPAVITNGLSLNVDAGFTPSYPMGGTSWYGVGPSGYTSALINGPAYSTSGGGSIIFDGVDDYANVGTFADILSRVAYTKVAWFYLNTYSYNIISGGDTSPTLGLHAFWMAGTNKLSAGHNNLWQTIVSTTSLSLNTWYFGAVTFNTSTGWKLYVNGALEATNASTTTFSGTGVILLGSFNQAQNLLNGRIAVAQTYNRVLSDSEILQNYQAMFPRFLGENLVSLGLSVYLDAGYSSSYPGSGTTWYSVAGITGGNGILTNGPTYSSSNRGTIVFDGIDDYVNLGNLGAVPTVNIGIGDMSVSIWVKPTALFGINVFFASSGSNQVGFYGLGCRSNGQAFFATTPGGAILTQGSAGQITTNTWFNLVGTRTSGTIRLYVNGTQVGTPAVSSDAFNNANARIGINPDAGSEILQGSCGIFSIYSRALSATEVLQNFNAQRYRFGV